MGPVGLYLAIKLLELGDKVIHIEERIFMIRKQILLINHKNYNKLKKYINTSKEEFVRVDLPPITNDGKICNAVMDIEDSVYSIPIYILQKKLYEYILNNFSHVKYTRIRPMNDKTIEDKIITNIDNLPIIKFTINKNKIEDDESRKLREDLKLQGANDDLIAVILEDIPDEIKNEEYEKFNVNINQIKNIFLCSGGRDIISKKIYEENISKIDLLCPEIKDKKYVAKKQKKM